MDERISPRFDGGKDPPGIQRNPIGRSWPVGNCKSLKGLNSCSPLLGTSLKNYRTGSMDWVPVYHFFAAGVSLSVFVLFRIRSGIASFAMRFCSAAFV